MKTIIFFFLLTGSVLADVNILILGSGRSFSEGRYEDHQAPLKPSLIAGELKKILSMDKSAGKVNVAVDEYYTKKDINTAVGGKKGQDWKLTYHRYSLAQYYFWPEGREKRLKNLKGNWDYVILIDDPYLTANMPGFHAEGVKLLANEINKGKAKTLIFSQWPSKGSNKTAAELNEISFRIARGLGIHVVPAAYVWSKVKNVNEDDQNYIAANSIYRRLFYKNVNQYRYKKAGLDAQIKSSVKEGITKSGFNSVYTKVNPFTMKQVTDRQIWGNHTGTSTERGLTGQLKVVFNQANIHFNQGKKPAKDKIDFNYGRANSAFEANKKYKVDPSKFDRSYGIVMQDNGRTAYETMLYGIDRRTFQGGNRIDDGTDMGIAYDMIRQKEVDKDIRTIPGRLISAKIMDYDKPLIPVNTKGDTWHQRKHLLLSQASFVYTSLTARYGLKLDKSNEQNDMMVKIGYDTAWTMSTLQARSPGFIVRSSTLNQLSLKKDQEESMKVLFANKPKDSVKVYIYINGQEVEYLTFTPENYNTAQKFTFNNSAGKAQAVTFKTISKDPVYHRLSDKWEYKSE